MESNKPGRYVMAPVESEESDSEEEEENIDERNSTPQSKTLWSSHMPKLPKMAEKANAHEKLIEWKKYKRSIDYYFQLTHHSLPASQKLHLLYLGGGPEIQKALEHFVPIEGEEDQKAFETMIAHMDKYFQTGVDSLAYVLQFFNMKQKDDEPFADFAQRLKAQADLCELGIARENMLKSQIQKGAKNAKVFASAESWVNKTLDDIIGLGIADETGSLPSSSKVKQNLSRDDDTETVGRVEEHGQSVPRRFPRSWRRSEQRGRFTPRRGNNRPNQNRQYPYSSGQDHGTSGRSNIQCYSCKKFGHMARDCRSRGINIVDDYNVKVDNGIHE
jgi:Zinc knuckle